MQTLTYRLAGSTENQYDTRVPCAIACTACKYLIRNVELGTLQALTFPGASFGIV